MDKNTLIGLVLIFLILIGFSYFSKPGKEEVMRRQEMRDSLARVELERRVLEEREQAAYAANEARNEADSLKKTAGVFAQDSLTEELITLENNKVRMQISTLGARIVRVELKEYVTHDSLPLVLWEAEKSAFGLSFYARNQQVNTEKMLFVPATSQRNFVADTQEEQLSLKLFTEENKYIEFRYTLAPDSYKAGFTILARNMDDVIASNTSFLSLFWGAHLPQLEKSKDFENRYTGLYYNFLSNDVEQLSESSDDEESLSNKVKWIAFKQQFFSSVLIAEESFSDVRVLSQLNNDPGYLKNLFTEISLPYSGADDETFRMEFYFGPNSYPVLKEYGDDIELEKLVNLGWKWLAWFNRYVVIPIFHFLENNVTRNYGLIIFLLTLIIKLVLFPMTYKSYLSQARMRILKPQIDEITKKIPADKALERQQATMALYKKAGVNPMGGCLPMLLQMPILIALFWFFPGAIELRQKSFLWASDLASYDSIATLPFSIPFYGNHVSLFCLLMTAVNIIYMRMSNKNQPQNDQMKSMQLMMYIMPVMFLFIFNSYSAGLSYYYLVMTLITIVQTWLIRRFVSDEKLLQQIEAAKARPVVKSKFQQRLEQMQRMQEQNKRNGRKK